MAKIQFTDGISTVTFTGLQRSAFTLAAPDGENPVTEEMEAVASSGSQALSDIQTLERMFARARERWAATGSADEAASPRNPHILPCYAQIDLNETGDWWRAEVMNGRAGAEAEPLSFYTLSGMVRYPVFFTHTAGWEGAEASVSMTPAGGSAATTINVGLFDNFYVTGFNSGNMPARCRIELLNTTNVAASAETIWLGLMRNTAGVNTGWVGRYEAEAGSGGTTQSDASCYGGQYRTNTWAVATPVQLVSWFVPLADCNLTQGRRVRPVVRWRAGWTYTDVSVRFAVLYAGSTELATTPWQRPRYGAGVHEGFSLPLPPRWVGGTPANHNIAIYAKRASGASTTIEIDQLFLMPAEQFCRYKAPNYYLPYNERLVTDGIAGVVYSTDNTNQRASHYSQQGEFFTLWPGLAHSFSVAHVVNQVGATPITRTMQVQMWARPRRSTL